MSGIVRKNAHIVAAQTRLVATKRYSSVGDNRQYTRSNSVSLLFTDVVDLFSGVSRFGNEVLLLTGVNSKVQLGGDEQRKK